MRTYINFVYLQYLQCFKALKITNDRMTVISDRSMKLIPLFVFLVITAHSYMELIYSEPSTNEAPAVTLFCLLHLWYTQHLWQTDKGKSRLSQKSLSRCHHESHVGCPDSEPMCQGWKSCDMTWWKNTHLIQPYLCTHFLLVFGTYSSYKTSFVH